MKLSLLKKSQHVHTDTLQFETFSEFCIFFTNLVESQNEDIPKQHLRAICGGVFKGSYRNNENFQFSELLGIDIDKDNDRQAVLDALIECPYCWIHIESPSSTPENYKGRILLLLDKPCMSAEEWKKGYCATVEYYFPTLKYDRSVKDAARYYYVPNKSKIQTYSSNDNNEKITFQKPPEKKSEKIPKKVLDEPLIVTVQKIQDRLEYLTENNLSITKTYDDWMRIAYSVASLKFHGLERLDAGTIFLEFAKLDAANFDYEASCEKFQSCWDEVEIDKSGPEKIYAETSKLGFGKNSLNMVDGFERPGIVEVRNSRFALCYKSTQNSQRILLTSRDDEYDVLMSRIKVDYDNVFELTKEDITYEGKDGKIKDSLQAIVKQKFRETPSSHGYILGSDTIGRYYNPKKDIIEYAKHAVVKALPIFHKDIDDWVKQMPIDYEWFLDYLYFLTDCTKALPMLAAHGDTNAGKTLLGLLLASVFGTEPSTSFFDVESFKLNPGKSPVFLLDEEIKKQFEGGNTINKIKSFITSGETEINMKYKSEVNISGYPRLICALNMSELKIPINELEDDGAIKRRMRIIHFTKKNAIFLENLGSTVIKEWLDKRFPEYVAWVRQTRKPKEHSDILAIPSYYDHETAPEYFAGFDPVNQLIFESMVESIKEGGEKSGIMTSSTPTNGFYHLTLSKQYSKTLLADNILRNMKSANELSKLAIRFFGKMETKSIAKKHIHLLSVEAFEKAYKRYENSFNNKEN